MKELFEEAASVVIDGMDTPRRIQVDSYWLIRKVTAVAIGSFAEGVVTFGQGLYGIERLVDPDG